MSKQLTNEEIQKELEKNREEFNKLNALAGEYYLKAEELRIKMLKESQEREVPVKLDNSKMNWNDIIELAEGIVNRVNSGEYHEDNDDETYIYEAVMETVYGEDFFKWFNKYS